MEHTHTCFLRHCIELMHAHEMYLYQDVVSAICLPASVCVFLVQPLLYLCWSNIEDGEGLSATAPLPTELFLSASCLHCIMETLRWHPHIPLTLSTLDPSSTCRLTCLHGPFLLHRPSLAFLFLISLRDHTETNCVLSVCHTYQSDRYV